MSYCLNPNCQKPINSDNLKFCQNCGLKLLLKDTYCAIAPIGQGGMGRTFKAINTSSSQLCVIKQFQPHLQTINTLPKAIELFDREAEQLRELGKHPQIPALIDYLVQDEYLYLIQELIEGQNLAEELQTREVFSELEIRQLLIELLPVLQFIHNHKVIHRDIKPANIIRPTISKAEVVLVDFGAAKVSSDTKLSQTGTLIGSAEYVSPEQARGKAVFASDIYSLGVTCIHLLTKVSPFNLFDDGNDRWMWRDRLGSPISDSLGYILDKMLARPISQRYASVAAVLQDLNSLPIQISLTSFPKLPISIDYTKLRDLLASNNWQAADLETTKILLQITNKVKIKELAKEDIEKIPCQDLRLIDQLWASFSNERFGFSIQKTIWENLGGSLFYDADNYWRFAKTYLKFADRIGWRKKKFWFFFPYWLKYKQLDFSLTAPQGHLPTLFYGDGFNIIDCLFSRLKICQTFL